jgi:hypothetical protein
MSTETEDVTEAEAILRELAESECRGVVSEGWCGTDVTPGDPATHGCIYCGAEETSDGKIKHDGGVIPSDPPEPYGCIWVRARKLLGLP